MSLQFIKPQELWAQLVAALSVTMTCKAILFDLDGTLLDTLEDLCNSMNRVLKQHGFPPHPLDNCRYFVGEGAGELVRRALPENKRDRATSAQCLEEFKQDYSKNWKTATTRYPGIPELLDELTRLGIPMSILSNKPDSSTKLCVTEFLSDWEFELVVGHREGYPRKPDPKSALEIAHDTKIQPAKFLYVGDTSIDMKTANRAGMLAVGVLWGFRGERELIAGGARHLLKTPLDLIKLI